VFWVKTIQQIRQNMCHYEAGIDETIARFNGW
jgi:hypothetical protein